MTRSSGWAALQQSAGSASQAPSISAGAPGSASSPPSQAPRPKDADLNFVQSAVSVVHVPEARAVAKALGIQLSPTQEEFADSSSDSLEELGDIEGSGTPQLALKRVPLSLGLANASRGGALPSWNLFLLAWDGAQWHASRLTDGSEPFELRVLSSLAPTSRQIALVVYSGSLAIPNPTIYQVKDHTAALLWDARSSESQYQGYARGKVEFRRSQGNGVPQMIVSGRADPGVLHFPKGGTRGFDAQTIYEWDGKGYVPSETEYVANPDYRLYQFISALHLHDFRSAYALVDAAKFLNTDAPSLQVFRQRIENAWPEFLDDQIFEARDSDSTVGGDFAFELTVDDRHSVYHPSFSAASNHRLTGLERREEKLSR